MSTEHLQEELLFEFEEDLSIPKTHTLNIKDSYGDIHEVVVLGSLPGIRAKGPDYALHIAQSVVMAMQGSLSNVITANEAAVILGTTAQGVTDLEQQGMLPKSNNKFYEAEAVIAFALNPDVSLLFSSVV